MSTACLRGTLPAFACLNTTGMMLSYFSCLRLSTQPQPLRLVFKHSEHPQSADRPLTSTTASPITDVTSNDVICNGGVNPLRTPLPSAVIDVCLPFLFLASATFISASNAKLHQCMTCTASEPRTFSWRVRFGES